jgi:hypothetical protein
MAAAGGADKKALREAAERIEQGIERYAAGDVAASSREFEEALALVPGHARALQCLSWVKDLQSGKRSLGPKPGAVDEDTLQQVTDLLNDQPGFDVPVEETTKKPPKSETRPAESDAPISSAPAPAPAPSVTPRTFEPATPVRRGDSSTLMGVGVSAFDKPLLTPTPRPSPLYAPEENTASRTREWRGTPTGTNLPLLDVPELTDEQVQELLALDAPPSIVEMEAEPTPLPHRNPLPPEQQEAQAEAPDPLRLPSGEFDALDQTPTRDRSSMLKAIAEYDQQAPAANDEDLHLPPLEVPRDFTEEGGTNPTNPFIQRRLMEQRAGTQPRIEELPAPPLRVGYDTNETPALEPHLPLQEALERGDFTAAVDAAEKFVADAGGLDTPQAQPQHWLLGQAYESMIGSLDKVPSHGQATPDLDPRSAFMLSRIDGMSSAEDLLEVSGMPRLEALRLLALLVRRGVVTVK